MLTPASSERVACERHESHAHHHGARRVEDGQCDVDWQEVRVAKEDRGFASMDRAKQREIASKGGKAAHQKGTAHEWTSEEAREAGRKGGMARHRRRSELTGSETTSEHTQAMGSVSEIPARDASSDEQLR